MFLSHSIIKTITWRIKTGNLKRLVGANDGEITSTKVWNGHIKKNSECNCDKETTYTYWIVTTELCWWANTRHSENEKFLCAFEEA